MTTSKGRSRPKKIAFNRLDQRTEDFFKTPDREGGPVDPLFCFEQVFFAIFGPNIDVKNK